MVVAPKRARRAKLSREAVAAVFAKKGDKLITKKYFHTKQTLIYKCGKCKRMRAATYNNYYRGNAGCAFCNNKDKIKTNENVLRKIVLRQAYYNMAEVCKIFNFEYGDFSSKVRLELLPAPTKKIGAKLYYTENDIQKIRNLVYLDDDKLS